MLPKHSRLKRTKDFARVRRFGRFAGSPLLALYVQRSRDPLVLVGFSVSKKVGKATVRNRVKRRLREALRHRLSRVLPGQHLVFVARPRAAAATFEQLSASVDHVLTKSRAMFEPEGSRNA
jgi:ribonuclease P protein component